MALVEDRQGVLVQHSQAGKDGRHYRSRSPMRAVIDLKDDPQALSREPQAL